MVQALQARIIREWIVVLSALSLAAYEIVEGGGRAPVLTFLAAVLASPVIAAIDRKDSDREKAK